MVLLLIFLLCGNSALAMMDDGSPREETNPTPTHVSRFDKGSAVGRAVLHEIIGYSDTYILAELNPEQFELIAWLLSENEAHVREKKFVVQKKVEGLNTYELLKKVNESYDKKSVQLSRFLYELDLLSLHNIIRLYGMRERINIVYEKDFALAFNLLRYFLERESIKLSGSLVNQIDSQGYTPLMRLSNFLNDQISRDTIDRLRHLNAYGSLLLSYGADPRAVAISFIFVVVTTIIYQFLFFLTTGPALLQQTNYLGIFPPLLSLLLPAYWQPKMLAILYAALATASLGGSYGILFSNHWNLYALAQHGHIWGHTLFTQLNIYYIPRLCVLAQIPFCITYLIVTNAQASHLQQISVFGCILAYALSVLGLLAYICQNKSSFIQKSMASLAFISCLFIISLTVRNLMHYGLFSLLIFAIFLLLGISMYATSKTPQN